MSEHIESSLIIPCGTPSDKRFLNLSSKKFGRLNVIRLAGKSISPSGKAAYLWDCECDCGVSVRVRAGDLTSSHTTSCGCWKREVSRTHGKTNTPEFKVWNDINGRCKNQKHKAWKYYGARGIGICERWGSFENFLEDMGTKPNGLSIERRDNNIGYQPDNCYWATQKQQMRNTRHNRLVTFKGETLCCSAWAEKLGFRDHTISDRLRAGWTIERALTEGVKQSIVGA